MILVERQEIPVPGASIWAVAKSSHYYQGAQTGPEIGTLPVNQSICVSKPPNNTRKSLVYVGCTPARPPDAEEALGIE
ncbi:hypothetical protein AYI69_g4917 [Smittium culicis]|uniref:Uncharacterized protein n=1 Tax=Smittium culicis TaxID=133412 RepID=A0A1R1Y9Q3_9FUNG|nr:hypothetical protein AYI69_g4917 [Smittium culicis]